MAAGQAWLLCGARGQHSDGQAYLPGEAVGLSHPGQELLTATGKLAHARPSGSARRRIARPATGTLARARPLGRTHRWRAASIHCACPRSSPRAAPTSRRATRRTSPYRRRAPRSRPPTRPSNKRNKRGTAQGTA